MPQRQLFHPLTIDLKTKIKSNPKSQIPNSKLKDEHESEK